LVLDLYNCNNNIKSKRKLQQYVNQLCKLIEMKKFGKTLLPYFGLNEAQTKGYSLLQFIETSSITGHFSEFWNRAYINIFSCKKFDHQLALEFSQKFFEAKKVKSRFLVR
jgi:S-adenosylmethionine/arginine decarboxylase-like enzyme